MSDISRRLRPQLEELEDRVVPTLLGQSLFPADNPWNQNIANAPVAANSAAIMNSIITGSGNGRLHPDFGQDTQSGNALYGIPINVVHGNSTPKVHVVIDSYASESDLQNAPITGKVVIEGDFQNGPNVGVANRGDSHLILWDEDANIDYEFFHASRPSENADGQWHADQETVWNMNTNTFRTLGFTSADAAGLAILPGLARPDEGLPTSLGGQGGINHALRFTLQNKYVLDQFIYPASHIADSGNNSATEPPMGARFRLKASVDISTLDPESQIIAAALKQYGLILADNGSNFFFSGASYSVDGNNSFALTWNDADIQDSVHGLKSLTFSDFEMVDLTPAVTGLSANSGISGTTLTVLGHNFSGAAGHLQVFFGNTPSTSVTVVDDSHLNVVVPAGSGTVDVRVQSGVTISPDSENVENTIFGYGISAVTTADQFTYSVGTNQPPTVATPTSASPNPVTGTTTKLSVLGADDGGEASLRYTWTSTGPAVVGFSLNGTNAAKNATATFTQSGTYQLLVTITDAGGLSTTSSVSVAVTLPVANQPPTVATPASASPNPVASGKTTTLSVLGADDGGATRLTYNWSVTSKPTNAPAPTFSTNGTNASRKTVATFGQAGTYTFLVTITDAGGLSVKSSVTVTVQQKLTTIKVTPSTATVKVRGQLQFSATAFDQFGLAMLTQPVFKWTTSRGQITSTGLFSAPGLSESVTITATAGGVHGKATVSVVA